MKQRSTRETDQVVGLDLGDRWSQVVVVDKEFGEVIEESRVRTTSGALSKRFESRHAIRVVLEAGTHSPWVGRLLERLGHEVIVANPRKLRWLSEQRQKDDRIDATTLARVGRLDVRLLHPVTPKSAEAQQALAMLRARESLVATRTRLILHCRGSVKSWGERLPSCDARSFAGKVLPCLPEALREALTPVVETVGELTQRIRHYDRELERLADRSFPQTQLLRQVRGVGVLTALCFVLTIGDPGRFSRCRQVAGFVGLVPARAESGERRPQLRISKEGDRRLRALLVQSAHYLLGPFGEDCDLRRFGERLVARGGRAAKRRAVVAVARKLSVLLLHLWKTAEVYEPLYRDNLEAA